jgi:PAS domain S-box-containing protein
LKPPNSTPEATIHLLAAIVDSTDDAVVSKTLDGIITSWNRAAERMFGYLAAEAIGQSIRLIIPPERQAEEDDVLARLRRGEKIDHFQTVRRKKNGDPIMVSITVSPVRDATGRIIGASKVARDITEQKRAEREREELLSREKSARRETQEANEILRREVAARHLAEARLREALQARDDFVAVAAHELRNPLNAFLLTLQLLRRTMREPDVSSQVRGLVEKLRNQAERFSDSIDRLLDVSRIQAGNFELHRETFDFAALVKEVVNRFAEEDTRTPISIERAECAEGDWDRFRIEQVVSNLISNAIKYGKRQPIAISVARNGAEATLAVRDHGIGIPPEDIERVFDRFERVAPRSPSKGLGLGLWIARRIVEAHGGTISAQSELNQGSTFTVRLPLQARS